jgi:zinc protease
MHALPLFCTLLSFTQLKLDNGLTVLVHEDHTVPIVAVDVWYRVGSRDEVAGKTGFAHLFEHMMFQGSAHVGDDQHFKYLQQAGGWGNATTSFDRTNYFEVLPSNALELGLWLEADRMGFLLQTLTQEKLDNQRDVVRNERRQSYENQPYGMASMSLFENLFPPNHPYHHLPIGAHADLESASLDDVRAFFKRYYAPANASLAIAGDVDTATVKRLVEKYFAPRPSPSALQEAHAAPPMPRLTAEKRVQLSDRVSLERVYLVWLSAPQFAPGDAELDLLAQILGSKSGRLYKRLVYENRLAQSVQVSQSSQPWASMFQIIVTAKPGHRAAEIVPIVDEEVARVRNELVSAAELERAKNQFESSFFYGLMSVGGFGGRADQLNEYSYFAGDPGYLDKDLQRYRDASAESVRAWAQKTMGPGRVVLTVSPTAEKAGPAGKPQAKEVH